jgi:hypothetical protein
MKITYKYTDKIWKTEVGPCDAEQLGRAWFKNRITKESNIQIVELDKSAPLWTIPDFKSVQEVRRREWMKLVFAAAFILPLACGFIWWASATSESPDLEKERKAKEWLSDPVNREQYNRYMREKKKEDQ